MIIINKEIILEEFLNTVLETYGWIEEDDSKKYSYINGLADMTQKIINKIDKE